MHKLEGMFSLDTAYMISINRIVLFIDFVQNYVPLRRQMRVHSVFKNMECCI